MILHQQMRGKNYYNLIIFEINQILFSFHSSSKGNSEEETNEGVDQFVDCIISTTDEFKSNEDQHNEKKLNGTDNVEEEKRDEVKDELKSNG